MQQCPFGLRFGGGRLGLLGLVGEIAGVIDMQQNPDRYKLSPDQGHCNMLGEPVVPGVEELVGECGADDSPFA